MDAYIRISFKGHDSIDHRPKNVLAQLGGDIEFLLVCHMLQQQFVNGVSLSEMGRGQLRGLYNIRERQLRSLTSYYWGL